MTPLLTKENFDVYQGERFVVQGARQESLALTLIESNSLGARRAQGRQPFSLLFCGPSTSYLPQATYRFEHTALGLLELFIVPIAKQPEGFIYEAIFN